eukprot:CAMPEP_0172612158 /NCGR_PEP_ID=MMETSP1068-20121228/31746_1 /TAXON_ID=35684 /ORGANISM="Pseudopedinella elastica, Strain CCMP716" /LENGTH=113 /DNA_ID=CAMNT_0013416303 /DNA_START=73 /DNA_END=410 /DNA_ORIENTATION=-
MIKVFPRKEQKKKANSEVVVIVEGEVGLEGIALGLKGLEAAHPPEQRRVRARPFDEPEPLLPVGLTHLWVARRAVLEGVRHGVDQAESGERAAELVRQAAERLGRVAAAAAAA